MASPVETPTERHQRLANRQRETDEKEKEAAAFIERLATEKAERQQNNKRLTATERLLMENKQKQEEEEMLLEEKQQREEEGEKRAASTSTATDAMMEEVEEQMEEDDSDASGVAAEEPPPPAKRRKKKDRHKKKRSREKTQVTTTFAEVVNSPPSLIRRGKYSASGGLKETANEEKMQSYMHKNKRYLWDMGIELTAEDKYSELTHALRSLLTNGQMADSTLVMEPIIEGGKRLVNPSDIPFNHTALGLHVKVKGGSGSFKMKKPWKKNINDSDDEGDELRHPVVKFTIAFSSDETPEEMLDRVDAEWGKLGGLKTWPNKMGAFATLTPVVLYIVHNGGHKPTLLRELTAILEQARDAAALEDSDFQWAGKEIPVMGLRPNIPRIPGQDTTVFSGWSQQQAWMRKCLHVEVDRKEADCIRALVTEAKTRNLFAPMWGRNAKLCAMADEDTRHVDLSNLSSFVKHHVNYHASMTSDGLVGIANLDKPVPFYSVSDRNVLAGHMTLRHVLYNYVKLTDGHALCAELHQLSPLSSVDVVIPNTPEAERMMLMMKKNLGAYLNYYLTDLGMGPIFINNLLRASIDPSMLHGIQHCTWDKKTRLLITPECEEEEQKKAMETAAWYKNSFEAFTDGKGKKPKSRKDFASPDMMFDLDGDLSVNTIHNRPGKGYSGSPGAAVLDLSGKEREKEEIVIDDTGEDNMSAMSQLSKGELIELLKSAGINSTHKKGSRPTTQDSKSSSTDSGSRSSRSSESSGSSSSSNSSAELRASTKKAADEG